jgi:hypothetical protein
MSLVGRVRLAAATPFLQAFEMVCGSSKAPPSPKLDGRWRWMLLVLGVSFSPQEFAKIVSSGSTKVLCFDEANPGQ